MSRLHQYVVLDVERIEVFISVLSITWIIITLDPNNYWSIYITVTINAGFLQDYRQNHCLKTPRLSYTCV